ELNRRLVAEEGRLLRLAETAGVKRADFVQHYMGDELSGDWLERAGKLPGRGWPKLGDKHVDDVARHRAAIAHIAGEAKLPIAAAINSRPMRHGGSARRSPARLPTRRARSASRCT